MAFPDAQDDSNGGYTNDFGGPTQNAGISGGGSGSQSPGGVMAPTVTGTVTTPPPSVTSGGPGGTQPTAPAPAPSPASNPDPSAGGFGNPNNAAAAAAAAGAPAGTDLAPLELGTDIGGGNGPRGGADGGFVTGAGGTPTEPKGGIMANTQFLSEGGAVEGDDGDGDDDGSGGGDDDSDDGPPPGGALGADPINQALETVDKVMDYGRQKHGLSGGGGQQMAGPIKQQPMPGNQGSWQQPTPLPPGTPPGRQVPGWPKPEKTADAGIPPDGSGDSDSEDA